MNVSCDLAIQRLHDKRSDTDQVKDHICKRPKSQMKILDLCHSTQRHFPKSAAYAIVIQYIMFIIVESIFTHGSSSLFLLVHFSLMEALSPLDLDSASLELTLRTETAPLNECERSIWLNNHIIWQDKNISFSSCVKQPQGSAAAQFKPTTALLGECASSTPWKRSDGPNCPN